MIASKGGISYRDAMEMSNIERLVALRALQDLMEEANAHAEEMMENARDRG